MRFGRGGGRTSNIEHRTSNIEHRTSNIEHRTPNIELGMGDHQTTDGRITGPPRSKDHRDQGTKGPRDQGTKGSLAKGPWTSRRRHARFHRRTFVRSPGIGEYQLASKV